MEGISLIAGAGCGCPGLRDGRWTGTPSGGNQWMVVLRGTVAMVVAMLAISAGVARGDEAARRDAEWLERFRRAREALEWTDIVVRHDWRLQERPADGHCRIVGPEERIVREGSDAECRAAFAALEQDGTVSHVTGPTVIVLHGLGEGRDSMRPLADHLRATLQATVLLFGYASTSADIDAHGRALAAVVTTLPDAARISFVGHSLGNLVVRRWMALAPPADLARAHRMVMLGPPNRGSDLARGVGGIGLLAGLARGAARDLVVDWRKVEPTLAVPPCDFGIVAGGKGNADGFSRLLAGDDDAVVRVDETRLDGADDFLLVPVHHAAMMRDPVVQQATVTFLAEGRFPPPQKTAEPRVAK